MTIATPIITDFDIEDIAPWAGNRLIDLHMATLPSKPFARFFPWNKNALNLGYQKLRPRYEPMDEITQAPCEPLCQEGWYFDCETETCKEYSSYIAILNDRKEFLLRARSTEPSIVEYNEETPWWNANIESLYGLAMHQSLGLQPLYTIQDFSPSWKQINSVTISSLVPTGSSYNIYANPSNTMASPYFIKTFIKVSKFDYINFESPDLGYIMDDITYLQVYSWKLVDTFSLYGVK